MAQVQELDQIPGQTVEENYGFSVEVHLTTYGHLIL
jgi:hypothetical protein